MVGLKEIIFEYIGVFDYVEEIVWEVEMLYGSDIKVIIGFRRVGKIFFMLKKVKNMLENGENVFYFLFDEFELVRMEVREFVEEVRKEYLSGKVILFFDEVQEWGDWDRKFCWFYDVKDFDVYVLGFLLVFFFFEIFMRFRGRYFLWFVFFLFFREIIGIIKVDMFRERGRLKVFLQDYLKWGGFFEVWKIRFREKVILILEMVFYRDIIERFFFWDVGEFKEVFYYVLFFYGSYFIYCLFQRSLKVLGLELNVKILINYFSVMESVFLIFQFFFLVFFIERCL